MTAGRPRRAGLTVVLTSSQDAPHVGPVVALLEGRGIEVVTIRSDEVLAGRQRFSVRVDGGRARLRCDAAAFDASEVTAAWWRKPQWLEFDSQDHARNMSMTLELERLHHAIAALLPSSSWLNAPDAMRAADSRLAQLGVASAAGLQTPTSLVTNGWDDVRELAQSGDVIFKTLNGTLVTSDGGRVVYANRLSAGDLDGLATSSPYPGVFQPFIDKHREWRVTVVGDRTFAAAIDTAGSATTDWRRHQLTDAVRFSAARLPEDAAKACVTTTRELGLGFSAIDLIEPEPGRFVFLEANPNGQYVWLEDELGLEISAAIAADLANRCAVTNL